MRTDALFWAASGLSKPLTAAAAMVLAVAATEAAYADGPGACG